MEAELVRASAELGSRPAEEQHAIMQAATHLERTWPWQPYNDAVAVATRMFREQAGLFDPESTWQAPPRPVPQEKFSGQFSLSPSFKNWLAPIRITQFPALPRTL